MEQTLTVAAGTDLFDQSLCHRRDCVTFRFGGKPQRWTVLRVQADDLDYTPNNLPAEIKVKRSGLPLFKFFKRNSRGSVEYRSKNGDKLRLVNVLW